MHRSHPYYRLSFPSRLRSDAYIGGTGLPQLEQWVELIRCCHQALAALAEQAKLPKGSFNVVP